MDRERHAAGADDAGHRPPAGPRDDGRLADDARRRERRYKAQPEQAVDVLCDFLRAQLPRRLPDRFELVGQAVTELAAPGTVGETAQRLGVSERYLRRVFREAVGVSPKHFARITRVRTVIAQARHSWSDIAAYAGYTDQSHLIADFRSLMRVTPAAYATGKVPLSTC